uniref:NADH dehydrogenase subunit 4L n=1 Tax=Botrylloides giganteus TaxID=2034436 RepID=A0A024GWS8_9ASCI|nr:NADH dehydrogenase subunit 4L [Botrylloides giganteus]CCO25728.1 NADH dehydrogenase subunit 4L [Botrylloides giganteus]CDM98956.1 NADH dehydrogenase subunit 4L [Botrylloides giganteus]
MYLLFLVFFFFIFFFFMKFELMLMLVSLEMVFMFMVFSVVFGGGILWLGLTLLCVSACEGALGVSFLVVLNMCNMGFFQK